MSRDPHALIGFLEDREGWSFGYGPAPKTHDCARFCAAGVKAVTGVDPLKAFTGQWTTERGAKLVLARHGGMAKAVSEVMTEIDPRRAQRGDVGLTQDGALVLVEGEMVVGVTDRGLIRLPRAALSTAWTVSVG